MNGPGTNDDVAEVRRLLAECGIEESPELLSTLLRVRGMGRGAAPDPSPELEEQFRAPVLPLNPRPPRRRGFLLSAALIGAMAAGTSGVAASNPVLSVVSERPDDEETAEGAGADPDAADSEDGGWPRPDAGKNPAADGAGMEPDYTAGGVPPEAEAPDAEAPDAEEQAGPETAADPAAKAADPEVLDAGTSAAGGAVPALLPANPTAAYPGPAGPVSPVPAAARADATPGSLPAAPGSLPAAGPVPAAEPVPAGGSAEPMPAAEHGGAFPAPWGLDHVPQRGRGALGEDWNRSGSAWPGGGGRSAAPAPGVGWPGGGPPGGGQPTGAGQFPHGSGRGLGNVPAGLGALPAPSHAGR